MRSQLSAAKEKLQDMHSNFAKKIRKTRTRPSTALTGGNSVFENDKNTHIVASGKLEVFEEDIRRKISDLLRGQASLRDDHVRLQRRMAEMVNEKRMEISINTLRTQCTDTL